MLRSHRSERLQSTVAQLQSKNQVLVGTIAILHPMRSCTHGADRRTHGASKALSLVQVIMSKWKIKNCRDELDPQLNMQNPRFRIRIEHLISGMWGCTREHGRHVILARISMKQACSTMQSSVCLPAKAGQLHLKCWGSRW